MCRPSASSLSLLRAPTPNLTHERVPAAPKLLRQVPGDRASAGLGEPQQLQPRRGVRACKATPSQVGARPAAPVTPAAPRRTRPAARTLPQPPRPARPGRPGSPPQAALGRGASAASGGGSADGLTGPRRSAAALLSPPLPRSPRRWARDAGRPQ